MTNGVDMGILINLVGIILSLFSWFNPIGFDQMLQISLFILGFDMMGVLPKTAIFGLSVIFPRFGDRLGSFSWTLIFLFMSELILSILQLERPYRILIKPSAVFLTSFISLGIQPALIISGIDLLINLTHKD